MVKFTEAEQARIRKELNHKLRLYYISCQIITLLVFLVILPFFVLVAFIISLERSFAEKRLCSPFFREKRYTQNRLFDVLKFVVVTSRGETLFFSNLLKQIYLDELPQLINIIRGEMTLVGPRPNPEFEYNLIKSWGYYSKLLQRAGLTGGVQTAKGSDRHGDLSLDEDYMHFCINNNVFAIIKRDFQTIMRTFKLMKKAEGI
ncbi:MAG: hypothetical protein Kow0029_29930 [Candidatus Rifleibacteriota bacterium]